MDQQKPVKYKKKLDTTSENSHNVYEFQIKSSVPLSALHNELKYDPIHLQNHLFCVEYMFVSIANTMHLPLQ